MITPNELSVVFLILVSILGVVCFLSYRKGYNDGELDGRIRGWNNCRRSVNLANKELQIMGEKAWASFTEHIDR